MKNQICRFCQSQYLMTALSIAVLFGCHLPANQTSVAEPHATYARILIFPFQDMVAAFGADQTVQGPLSGKAFVTGAVEQRAAHNLSNVMARLLAQRMSSEAVVASRDNTPALGVFAGSSQHPELVDKLCQAGRQYGADAVLIGYLYDYQERIGSDYGVETPARICFELNLISVADGRLVWQDWYRETQQALNENLFHLGKFIQRKGRWITAEQMATEAMQNMMAKADVFRR